MPRIASLANITSFTATLGKIKEAVYPLTNSGATDPTSQQWRDNDAPASYEWIPNKGIYVDEGDPITNMTFMFNQSTFNDPDITTWDTSTVTLFNGAFANTTAFNQDISSWDISNVTRMDGMFAGAQAFNQDISSWDTSNVTQMPYMFSGAQAFNQNLTSWNTTSMAVDTIPTDFAGSSNFAARNWPLFGRNGSQLNYYPMTNSGSTDPTYSTWRSSYAPSSATWIANRGYIADITDPITSMRIMFAGTTFNDPDIQYWDVSTVDSLLMTFDNNSSFNQPIGDWNTSNVSSLALTFQNATAFNQDIGNWDVSKVYNMYSTFRNASAFNQDISGWDVSSVSSMDEMFDGATVFDQDLTGWNNSNVFMMVDTIPYFFATNSALPIRKFPLFGRDGSQLKYYPITNSGTTDPTDSYWRSVAPASATWIASRGYITDIADPITNMDSMFANNSTFNDSDLQYWDVSSATNMYSMFYGSPAFNANISNWNVGAVTTMASMFFYASSFNQNIGSWNVGAVTDMGYMFSNASSFNQDIGSWTVDNVTDMTQMFYSASAFNQDLTGWNVSSVTSNANFSLNANSSWTLKPIPVTNNFTGQRLVQYGAFISTFQTLSNNYNYELFSDSQIAGSLSNVISLQLTSTYYSQPNPNYTTQTMTFIGQNGSPDQQYYNLPFTSQVTTFYTGDLLPYIWYDSSSGKYYITIKIETTSSYQQFFPPSSYAWNHQRIELSFYFSNSWAAFF